jgi:hypothetical protein
MRDHHGQDRPLAGAAAGGPADRGGGGRAGAGLGPGECASYVLDDDGLVWRLRWPCDADDKWCAVDGMGHLDALAGRRPGGGAGDDHQRPVDPGPDGGAADRDAGAVPLADAHAGARVGRGAGRGTVDIGDWPDLSGGW